MNIYLGEKDHFNINLSDEVVRGSIVLHDGEMMWPPPKPVGPPAPAPSAAPAKAAVTTKELVPVSPFMSTFKDSISCTAGMENIACLF